MNRITESSLDLINLPIDVFHVVRLYISVRDYRQLLNANKLQYSKLKKYTVFYPLTSHFSWIYLNNESFRERLVSVLSSPEEQLALSLIGYSNNLENFSLLHNLYRLELTNVLLEAIDLTQLHDIHTLSINAHCELAAFPKLHNIRNLYLRNFSELVDVSNLSEMVEVKLVGCRYLTDITPLQNCQSLHFEHCFALRDISCLGRNQRSITFIHCPSLSEVNHLQYVEQITLRDCPAIRNIDNLTNIPSLHLQLQAPSEFPSRFHNRKLVLDLQRWHGLKESTFFDEIDELTIKNFKSDFTRSHDLYGSFSKRLKLHNGTNFDRLYNRINLERLYELELSECDVDSIARFGNVPILIISHCPGIHSLEGLGQERQKKVILSNSVKITDFSPLQNIPSVEIINCSFFTSLNALQNVTDIKVRLCENLKNISDPFPSTCHSVEINFCRNITSLKGLELVKHIIAIDCLRLHDISSLGKRIDQTVFFCKCSGILSIDHLREIKQVKIQECRCIRNLPRISQSNLIIVPDMEGGRIEQEENYSAERIPVKPKQKGFFLARFFCRK